MQILQAYCLDAQIPQLVGLNVANGKGSHLVDIVVGESGMFQQIFAVVLCKKTSPHR